VIPPDPQLSSYYYLTYTANNKNNKSTPSVQRKLHSAPSNESQYFASLFLKSQKAPIWESKKAQMGERKINKMSESSEE
jgi:hypothetical protein